jgi:hypothetical protein
MIRNNPESLLGETRRIILKSVNRNFVTEEITVTSGVVMTQSDPLLFLWSPW